MNELKYFDNAATTYPKPPAVVAAVVDAIKYKGGNPGRGSHALSEAAAELVYDTRETAARFFDAEPENIVFTENATHALNYAIKGLARRGYTILIDNYAHNASYRPCVALSDKGFCTLRVYDASGNNSETLANIQKLIVPHRTIIIATHQSNISSKILPIEKIGALARETDCAFVVDAAQSAGHLPISLKEDGITALCMPGHKGLYGIMGSGMLISSPTAVYNTLIEGGAGIRSLDETMPDTLPERLEAGTLSLPAIASLKAGMDYISRIGLSKISAHEKMLSERFVRNIAKNERISLHGECGGSVVSFTVDGRVATDVAAELSRYGICTRAGYHCAPLAHKTVGTLDGGSVRVSFSHMNTVAEVDYLCDILGKIK